MMRPNSVRTAIFAVFAVTAAAPAQRINSPWISDGALQQAGYERAWQTHVTIDTSRGKVTHICPDLNGTNSKSVFDVVAADGKTVGSFQAGALDPKGRPVDTEGARRLADVQVRVLKELGTTADVQERKVPDLLLYVQTDRGTVQALDAETGATRWTLSPGNRTYPNQKPAVNDQFAAIINGSSLYIYDQLSAKIIAKKQLDGAPGAGATVGEKHVYVPLLNGMVEIFGLDDRPVAQGRVASYGRAMVTPTLTKRSLSWVSDRGVFHAADPVSRMELFRYETHAKVVIPSVPVHPDRLLVGTLDGYIHCVDELTGKLAWRFSCGNPVTTLPLVIDQGVFVCTNQGQLYRLSPENGREQWASEGVVELLGGDATRLIGRSHMGQLLVIDVENGTQIATIPTRSLALAVHNPLTDRIYLSSATGQVICIRPQGHPWPTLQAVAQREMAAAQEELQRRTAAAAAPVRRERPEAGSGTETSESADGETPIGPEDEVFPGADEEDAGADFGIEPDAAGEMPAGPAADIDPTAEEPAADGDAAGDDDLFGDEP